MSLILIGALFGGGLALSGMLNPSKVAGFLDLFGVWDPSLAFVMGGGVVANFIGHRLVTRRPGPVFSADGEGFRLPTANAIDSRLVIGSALFGIGWGLGGLCPGPAISSLLLVPGDAVLFVLMMLAGLAVGRMLTSGPAARPAAQP
ncbi:MAG: DUF6691 family protein [Pseudomonadota bacterium]|nr:DUF6691 family protein [Pseudomonadota bacterium]